ncbi:ammonia-forming cytochrome c nitrite reductase subunit c552 [uncultured Adlercreutzia sp.]|uniref:ammonia-forming cytochrome c nitrite reductase subunit c552 n=1 Tax=uncultured Adlercreutzia sp. TaxID=875803 RepID=UPI002667185D|nr:ammonia-forming cytochrome c nitrite reductase subunit c552 [uncultured Adlercreutzia sp.]
MKRVKSWKKPAVFAAAAVLVLACAACAPQGTPTAQTGGEAPSPEAAAEAAVEGALIQTGNHSWEKWQKEYPGQYETFIRGIDDVEDWDGKVHGHAALYANTLHATYSKDSIAQFGTSCIACKSTTATDLYNEMGIDGFMNDWDTYAGKDGEKVDWYDCGLCHVDGTPGGELKPGGMAATAFGAPLFEQVTDKEAVCGQCHNYIGAVYTRGGLMEKMKAGEVDPTSVNPWRYGFDPENLMKAALEDGYEMMVNPETGIATFQANHPEVEIFQGSVHQELGMTCVDCHGVKMQGESGEFTSHGFSESPLENPEALEYCLTCHTAQGVTDAEAMKEFVAAAQKKMADAEEAFNAKSEQLQGLIVAAKDGGADEAALEQAKENFTKATWFVRYADGGGDFPGMKIAHNPKGEIDYVERASVLMDEGIALLS